FTGYVEIGARSPLRFSPVFKENVFLCNGQATFGSPPSSPIIPRESTISILWGHMFWQAYQLPSLVKLYTATCLSLYFTQAPPFLGNFETSTTLNQTVTSASDKPF